MDLIQYLSMDALMARIRGRAQALKRHRQISPREYSHIVSFMMGSSERQELVDLALALEA